MFSEIYFRVSPEGQKSLRSHKRQHFQITSSPELAQNFPLNKNKSLENDLEPSVFFPMGSNFSSLNFSL
ncbi:unnamed protein product [Phytophthora fragariaefolia]|uniref:Unnamed protein product n=1 Tax=Phytophthora fragariaefolia TaxID=1490495 RepID=A0A9W6XRT0_9STRA|nr:unnamed protein product [Phytophthora fragariaefolia]